MMCNLYVVADLLIRAGTHVANVILVTATITIVTLENDIGAINWTLSLRCRRCASLRNRRLLRCFGNLGRYLFQFSPFVFCNHIPQLILIVTAYKNHRISECIRECRILVSFANCTFT